MIAYCYNAVTKLYEGTRTCQLDPLSTRAAGHPVWLLPGNATFEAPLEEKEGFFVLWNGTEWIYEAIPEPEPVVEPEPIVEPEPELTLEEVRTNKLAELKQTRDTKELEPVEFDGHYFDFDLKSYNRITAAVDVLDRAEILYQQALGRLPQNQENQTPESEEPVDPSTLTPAEQEYLQEIENTEPQTSTEIELPKQPTIMWTTADNTNVELTAEGLHGIIQAAATRSNVLHIQYRVLKNAIMNMESIADIQAIEWDDYEEFIPKEEESI